MIAVDDLFIDLVVPARPLRLAHAPVLAGVSFGVAGGQTLAIMGESGAGKSVLLQALMGLLPPGGRRSGTIRLDGAALSDAALRAQCGRMTGFAPQSLSCLDPTAAIGRQIGWAARRAGASRRAARCAAAEALERFDLPLGTADLYPHQLSGGMARRILLALATAGRPRLLMVDEPTAGLDEANAGRIAQDLRRIAAGGVAVIVVTHHLALALRAADTIALMRGGRMEGIVRADDFRHGGEDAARAYAHMLFRAMPENGMMEPPHA